MDFNITDSPMANKKATDRVATESAGLRASSSHPYSQTNDFRKSPEFFLTLGSLYLQQNLLNEAEEVLVRILPDHNLYVNATEVLIEVHSRKQNFQEVLRLGKQLQNSVSDPLWLAHQVGTAYYSLDEPIEAKPHFVKALSFIPEKTRLRSILKSLQPGTRCPNIKTLIRESVPFGITPHVVLGCLVPLLWGGHPASCCFADQLSFFNSTNISDPNLPKRFSLVAAYLYHQFGIYTAFLPYVEFSHKAGTPLVKIYLSLRSSLMDEVAEIEQSAWDGFEKQGGESKGRLEYLEKEGSLLGYPKCCVQWAVNNRVNNRTIERIALAALIEEECCSSTRKSEISSPLFAYYAHEFYPCRPGCAEAEQIGKDIFERYTKADVPLSEFYGHYVLPLNKAKMWHPFVKYRDFIAPFDDTILGTLQTSWQRIRSTFHQQMVRFLGKNGHSH